MKKPVPFGKYLLLERLNVGGMAEVFLAKQFGVAGFERILAIKRILPTMAEDAEFIAMFIDEARISSQLNHQNIVHVHELGRVDENYFIAMEYVAGRDLRAILEFHRKSGSLVSPAQAAFIASRMCEGLEYAHRRKDARGHDLELIHRDISPQNILVSYDGGVKLIDFGIAKAANRSQKTQAGILKGKFGYMSPEQVRGLQIDRRSDLFAVGVILYELLTGEKLFTGESDYSVLEKVRDAQIPSPRLKNPAIPAGLEKVMLRALAREPDDRYQWASDLQEDLSRFLLQGDALFTSKELAAFMRDAFSADLIREADRMQRFAAVGEEQIESGEALAGAPRVTSAESPAAAARMGLDPSDQTDGQVAALESFTTTGSESLVPSLDDEGEEDGEPTEYPAPRVRVGGAAAESQDRDDRAPSGQVIIGDPSAASAGATVAARQAPLPSQNLVGETLVSPRPANGHVYEATISTVTREPRAGELSGGVGHRSGSSNGSGWSPPRVHPLRVGLERAMEAIRQRPGVAIGISVGVLALVFWLISRAAFPDVEPELFLKVEPTERVRLHLDGMAVTNPTRQLISAGRHEVVAEGEGFQREVRYFTVTANEPGPIPFVFALQALRPVTVSKVKSPSADEAAEKERAKTPKQVYSARFEGPLDGVDIRLEGRSVGRTPNAIAKSLEGGKEYEFSASLKGYRNYRGTFRFSGEEETVKVTFGMDKVPSRSPEKRPSVARSEPKTEKSAPVEKAPEKKPTAKAATGKLSCSSIPAGAQVWINGKYTGRETPIPTHLPLALPVGKYEVVLMTSDKSLKSRPQTIEVGEDETVMMRSVKLE